MLAGLCSVGTGSCFHVSRLMSAGNLVSKTLEVILWECDGSSSLVEVLAESCLSPTRPKSAEGAENYNYSYFAAVVYIVVALLVCQVNIKPCPAIIHENYAVIELIGFRITQQYIVLQQNLATSKSHPQLSNSTLQSHLSTLDANIIWQAGVLCRSVF